MRRIVFAVLLAALLVAGCVQPGPSGQPPQGQEPKPVAAPQIVENGQPKAIMPESFGGVSYAYYSSPMFLLYYPRGWAAEEPGNGVFAFTAPVEGDPEKNVADQFIVEIFAGEEKTPDDYMNYEAEYMMEGDQVTNAGTFSFKDREAFLMEMTGADGRTGKPMHYTTIYFRNGKWVYRLQMAVEQARVAQTDALFEDMLDKFVVGDYN